MEDKVSKISTLETQIKIYSFIGWGFVVMALFPIGNVAIDVFIKSKPWPEAELGSFLGGVSGAFAALAGVFFVFVAFLGQRISIIQQQIEIQNNIQELRDTREEIKGQKEQLELQNKQFQIQSYETTFFNLLTHFRNSGPLDRISHHYSTLKEKFDYIHKYYTQSDSGDIIWHTKENSDRIIGSLFEFAQKFSELDDHQKEDVRDSVSQLIPILEHINNFPTIFNNHFSTLLSNISNKEKFMLFYFYITYSSDYSINHQKFLYDFFNKMNGSIYFDHSHRKWDIEPNTNKGR